MDYDALLPEIGAFGRYQKILIGVVLIPTIFPCAFQAYSQLFIAATPSHWCRVPELEDWNEKYSDYLKHITVPQTVGNNGQVLFDKCRMFSRNYTEINENFLEYATGLRNLSTSEEDLLVIPCRHGWHYDRSLYPSTVVSEFDLVCDKDFYSTFSLVIFGAGGLIGNYVFGYLQDHWGRKPSYFAYLFLQISGGFFGAFSWNFESWLFFRTVVGLTIPAILTSPYVIAIELVDPTKRTFCTIVLNIGYSVGLILLAVIVYFIRDWRHLSIAVSLPLVLLYLCYTLIPESPRWLIAVRKYEKAFKVLQKIAKTNGTRLTKGFDDTFISVRKKSDAITCTSAGIASLFRTPNIRMKTLIITFIWFTNTSVYVGLSYYAPALGGNEIINFLLAGLVELPTYVFLWPSLHYFGRRGILCLSMLIGGVSCLFGAMSHFQNDRTTTLILYCIGKMGISSAFVSLPLIASELYPTVIRGIGMSFSSVVAMIGPVLIPILNYMGSGSMVILPLLINGLLLTLGGLVSLLLPETKDMPLPQTIEDGETTSRIFKKKFESPEMARTSTV